MHISVCIIAKNEEKHIGECLRRLSGYHWEIVVTDTGSTDHTVEIARKYTPHIFHFDWINDFSAAKNFCVSSTCANFCACADCKILFVEYNAPLSPTGPPDSG